MLNLLHYFIMLSVIMLLSCNRHNKINKSSKEKIVIEAYGYDGGALTGSITVFKWDGQGYNVQVDYIECEPEEELINKYAEEKQEFEMSGTGLEEVNGIPEEEDKLDFIEDYPEAYELSSEYELELPSGNYKIVFYDKNYDYIYTEFFQVPRVVN